MKIENQVEFREAFRIIKKIVELGVFDNDAPVGDSYELTSLKKKAYRFIKKHQVSIKNHSTHLSIL